jgi:hypothetical protein
MANRGRATFAKRQREIQRQERAREKAAKRVEREASKIKLDRKGQPVDPDIAGIVPGPQARTYDLPEDFDKLGAEATEETEAEEESEG